MSNQKTAEKTATDTDAGKNAQRAAERAGTHARAATDAAQEAADLTYEELREQVETLKADLAGLADAARGVARQKAQEAYDGASRVRDKAVDAAEEGYEMAQEQLNDALSQAEKFARDRPALALGIAAGAGFLLAKYMSRR
jgi:ElaB/YqjD/DUF883 family membrane-anchored ribosome-binding protein